jgi:hypothetical protein
MAMFGVYSFSLMRPILTDLNHNRRENQIERIWHPPVISD